MSLHVEPVNAMLPELGFGVNDSPQTPDSGISISVGSDEIFYKKNSAGEISPLGAFSAATIYHEESDGVAGGTFENVQWRTRPLNTISDVYGIVSLSSNQFTPESGVYLVIANAIAYGVGAHQIRLRNVTNSINVRLGTSQFSPVDGQQNESRIMHVFGCDGSEVFELQHKCENTRNSDGFGLPSGNGIATSGEIYAEIVLVKLR